MGSPINADFEVACGSRVPVELDVHARREALEKERAACPRMRAIACTRDTQCGRVQTGGYDAHRVNRK